jgi:DNA polymerase (family 10)
MERRADQPAGSLPGPVSNAEIADRLASLAQLLRAQKENPHKVKAYQRAAAKIRTLPESLDALVHDQADLTRFDGIGEAIARSIREIVLTGSLERLEKLRSEASSELAGISEHPLLDPKRVLRIYKKLGISSIASLREKLDSGEIEKALGPRMAQHVRQGLTETHAMLLYRADGLRATVEEFLLGRCGVRRAEAAGAYRRRVEVVEDLSFVVETDDFPAVTSKLQHYGGRAPLLSSAEGTAVFSLPSGIPLRLWHASSEDWGSMLLACTGSEAHLQKLAAIPESAKLLRANSFATESALYNKLGLAYIEPELREGRDEVDRAAQNALPVLVTTRQIRGELHAHSTSSDGADSIEQMALAARDRGYEYIGITDHSQSLRIARGVPVEDLWKQIDFIDRLNARLDGIRILKSAEVDILADGSLDYPDEVLRELDYTVCSIHSRFAMSAAEQTKRVLRAMDNRCFHILGHATGRMLLRRDGYGLDMERVIAHARSSGCFFEINSNPNRLDLSAENARRAAAAGIQIAVSTDAHSTRELDFIRCGIDQARRAGLERSDILNCLPWEKLARLFKR